MSLQTLQGYQELSDDLTTIRRRFMQNSSPEERLEGLRPSERLEGLSHEEKDELLSLLLAERDAR